MGNGLTLEALEDRVNNLLKIVKLQKQQINLLTDAVEKHNDVLLEMNK